MHRSLRDCIASLAIFYAAVAAGPVSASDYFAGKTIRIVVGTPTGGGYDGYARLVARHLGDFIPGNPTVVVSNMPGGSGSKAASFIYSMAPADGTVIGTFIKSLPVSQALGEIGFPLKTEELKWIGSLSRSPDVVTVWHTSGIRSIEDAKHVEVTVGSDSPAGTMSAYPALLNATLGTRFRVIHGYEGGNAVNLAMERGELQGRGSCPWVTWKSTKPEWVAQKKIVPLVQISSERDPDLPDVPTLSDLAKDDEQRQIFQFVSAASTIERPYAAPPGTPDDVVQILRTGFYRMATNQAFREDAASRQMDIAPSQGQDVQNVVSGIIAAAPAVIQQVKKVYAVARGSGPK